MPRITIDCADPNDSDLIVEQAVGRYNVTYAKQALKLVAAGTVKSERQAARQIAEETGEPLETVRTMIKRGKTKMGSGEPKACCPNCGHDLYITG
jgi:Na+-transporting NADH:ubiquinone oxidoreductase subunit NqrF